MSDIVARCGYRCNLCLAYRDNIKSSQDQKLISDGWYKYYGFRIEPEDIKCDGCLSLDTDDPRLMDPNCPVRFCVKEKGLENCAYCQEFPCRIFSSRSVDYDEMKETLDKSIPEEDYENFIKPYEGKKILEDIRKRESL